MASLALQKLDVKDLVCMPLYRKLSPQGNLIRVGLKEESQKEYTSSWLAPIGALARALPLRLLLDPRIQ